MEYLGNLKVIPKLPERIHKLQDLAYNLYFSWTPEVRDIFIAIDRKLWKAVNHNPVKFLQEVQQKKLIGISKDQIFLKQFDEVIRNFNYYLDEKETWFAKNFPDYTSKKIAYFTAEFGLHESLPIYAGGLGVLAGDHLKSASDLGLPICGMSLFYTQTYFTQQIDAQGHQISLYKPLNALELPLKQVVNDDGSPLLVEVPMTNRRVKIRVWEAKVGRISAFLLDTNFSENQPGDREITSRLYGGDQEMRISQEIVLGMGGVLVLQALGIEPYAWHMNEGHSVFLALQRIKFLVENNGLTFHEAFESVTANTIFTTHTPVPAGNDAFPLHIKDKYFQRYWESVGIRRHEFMELGSQIQPEGYEIFNLTILALNLSKHRNGVSKLHGQVSRGLWKTVWPNIPEEEVPINYITNGVHSLTWVSRKMRALFDKYLGTDWRQQQDNPEFWDKIDSIPDQALWQTKLDLKDKMLNHVKERLGIQYTRNRIGTLQMLRVNQLMRPNVLTIGFARRFATYKRGTLILSDLDRLGKLLNNPERPVQLLFAGKAHPKDGGGQELIRRINEVAMYPEFRGKVAFVENYDMGLARDLISGVDVWLNNPRRTQEASGTSGEKAAMNGVLNFSVLDGWWCEGYNRENGWAFGDKEEYNTLEELDDWDAGELYDLLENDIIPMYYDRNEKGLPVEWIRRMKNAIKTILPHFNTHRMLKEYWEKLYIPAINLGENYRNGDFRISKKLAVWRDKIERHWSEVQIRPQTNGEPASAILSFGDAYELAARVKLGMDLSPSDVKVQIFLRNNSGFNILDVNYEIFDMQYVKQLEEGVHEYKAVIHPSDSGIFDYTLRVLPYQAELSTPVEVGICKWYSRNSQ